MSFKQISLIIILIVLVGATAAFFILKQNQNPKTVSENIIPSSTPVPVAMSTWTDEAGFSFQYPQGITIDKHPEDTTNYADLTIPLSSTNTVTIIMADNAFKDLSAWAGQNSAIDTTLGEKPAKKIIKDGQTTVACIDSGVLVTITGQDVSTIIDSWNFIYPTPTVGAKKSAPAVSNDSGDVLQEE